MSSSCRSCQETHTDSGVACDVETYLRRGWCRLEQWAFMSVHGINNMFMSGVRKREEESVKGDKGLGDHECVVVW